jgi:hypothetical protein
MSTTAPQSPPAAETRTLRRAGTLLVASGVTFVAGYALAMLAPEGSWIGNLVALPLVAGAVLLVSTRERRPRA